MPLADGGEGLLDVVGGTLELTEVRGPLGDRVTAAWRYIEASPSSPVATAVLEMATASGLGIVGGAVSNDAITASTYGTGELIAAALDRGARRIIVGLGGSATTDGGLGAIEVVGDDPRLAEVELLAACDVTTRFLDAARVFGPQKGADEAAVASLSRRLEATAALYQERFAVDVTGIPGSGAAGGLGGGLAALGASLRSGFGLVADLLGLDAAIDRADLVVTGEGKLDATSFAGKVVGGVAELAAGRAELCCVVGVATPAALELRPDLTVLSLTDRFGLDRAMTETLVLVEEILSSFLEHWQPSP